MTEFQRLQEELNKLPTEQREIIAAELLHELEEIQQTKAEKQDELTSSELIPFEHIQHLAGSLEGPGDLSTNPIHMEGFGQRSLQ